MKLFRFEDVRTKWDCPQGQPCAADWLRIQVFISMTTKYSRKGDPSPNWLNTEQCHVWFSQPNTVSCVSNFISIIYQTLFFCRSQYAEPGWLDFIYRWKKTHTVLWSLSLLVIFLSISLRDNTPKSYWTNSAQVWASLIILMVISGAPG